MFELAGSSLKPVSGYRG